MVGNITFDVFVEHIGSNKDNRQSPELTDKLMTNINQ